MDSALRQAVVRRAREACEYCHMPQSADSFIVFHIEHIIARQHGGATTEDNLALACHHCNLHKARISPALTPKPDG